MKKLSCLWWVLVFTISFVNAQITDTGKESFKDEFLQIINKARQSGCNCGSVFMKPVTPLSWNDNLAAAASVHAMDMFKRNFFSHTGSSGKSVKDRIMNSGYNPDGYRSYAIGENIAKGQESIAEVMKAWLKSEHHCQNLMNPLFKEIGVAQVDSYWVQDFGGREPFIYKNRKLANQP